MNNFDEKNIIELLVRRGFFIERIDCKYVLSDNVHELDKLYLDSILKEYNIGKMQNNEIIISNNKNGVRLQSMFESTKQIKEESCWKTDYQWGFFVFYNHGKKVPVEKMEANIAFYCKALSACGLDTISSCDGNHINTTPHNLFVRFSTQANAFWNYLIWKNILSKKFQINWKKSYQAIRVTTRNKNEVYDSIYQVAKYLYDNRIYFRRLKKDSTAVITKKFRRKHSDDEIKKELTRHFLEVLEYKENAIPL